MGEYQRRVVQKLWDTQFKCKQSYKYFKFDVLAYRGGSNGNAEESSHNFLQFAELTLYELDGNEDRRKIPIDKATNPGGWNYPNSVNPNSISLTRIVSFSNPTKLQRTLNRKPKP
jgi:hypothetical protein